MTEQQQQRQFTELKQAWNQWAEVANRHGMNVTAGRIEVQARLAQIKGEGRASVTLP